MPDLSTMQWVKDRWTLGAVFSRSGQFTRNDSSNSNSSGSNSAPCTPTPYTVRQYEFPNVKANNSAVVGKRNGHAKLSAKSSTASVTSINPTGSLRRQRFKQQYHSRLERRMSRQTSSGTSQSNSQELPSNGTSITANPVIDKLLEYLRDNYVKSIDPVVWDIDRKIRLTSFGNFFWLQIFL